MSKSLQTRTFKKIEIKTILSASFIQLIAMVVIISSGITGNTSSFNHLSSFEDRKMKQYFTLIDLQAVY